MDDSTTAGFYQPYRPERPNRHDRTAEIVRKLEQKQILRKANVFAQIDSLSIVQDAIATVAGEMLTASHCVDGDANSDGDCRSDSGDPPAGSADIEILRLHIERHKSLMEQWRAQIDTARAMLADCLRRERHAGLDASRTSLQILSLRRRTQDVAHPASYFTSPRHLR